jgi:Cu(I)/Ag(I) efflux system membrane fusion protein
MSKTVRFTLIALGAALAAGGGLQAACRRHHVDAAAGTAHAARPLYHCPMHPGYVSNEPGDCPICGMKLVPTKPSLPAAASPSAVAADRADVSLSPERRRMLGLRTSEVRRTRLARDIRTVGRMAVDERRLHHVHTKFEAYVEHLHVDFTGKRVKRGEPLASVYSPELVATQQEYLLAYRAQKQLGQSGIPSVAQGGVDLLEAARRRLLFWDIRPADIARLERTGEVERTLDLHSDISGYVVQKTAFHGMRVTPADTLFDIADLSHLWVLADVYESDLPNVREGMAAELTVPYLPGRSWHGAVTYIAPTVEEKTRTIKVRVEVDNRGEELKPEMFADVLLRTELGEGLVAPESAVIHAGQRQLAFVEAADGRLQPREVKIGAKTAEGLQVLEGLAAGERVVTSANFLLDSESSLRAALAAISPPPPGQPPASAPAIPHRH